MHSYVVKSPGAIADVDGRVHPRCGRTTTTRKTVAASLSATVYLDPPLAPTRDARTQDMIRPPSTLIVWPVM